MNAIEMLAQQLKTVNIRLHHVCRELSPELLATAIHPNANPIGFLLWHLVRGQDWAAQTAIRNVPEIARQEPWCSLPVISTPGIGTGFTRAEADEVAGALDITALLGYANAVNAEILGWVHRITEADLDLIPDVAAHDAPFPEYQRAEFLAEMNSGPERDDAVGDVGGQPVWLFLTSVCITHPHRHLGEIDLSLGILTGRAG